MDRPAPDWKSLYPFQSHWLNRSGLRLHYLDEGSGPPVLMLHGNPTWSFYYRELVRALAPTHRCIVPDHIGCGLSDKPPAGRYPYTLDARVADVEALLDHLDIRDNLTLVLHDWGGMIGGTVAVRRPERISRMVILNTAAFLLPTGKPLPMRLRVLRDGGPLAKLMVQGMNLFAAPAVRMASAKGLPRDVAAGLLAPYDSWANRIATLRFVQDIPLAPGDPSYNTALHTQENLDRLADKPMLICWGMKDFVFDSNFLAEWRRRFPQATVHTFPDAGHYVLEDARDEVIERVRAFLPDARAHTTPSDARRARAAPESVS